MAGSFRNLVDDDGYFTTERIQNLDDAYQALEECFNLIVYLASNPHVLTTTRTPHDRVTRSCRALGYDAPLIRSFEPASVDMPNEANFRFIRNLWTR